MKKVFTPKNVGKKQKEVVAPSEKTLDFLRQFARAYYVEKSLPRAVNEICVN
ncbi:hypothetical protein M2451_002038 [Dysgonomonas sp. PFB1-18]|nr:hypothetical protein [Dysgonomonas sp. PF1-14]MDH6339214.1 hypothetical protein [Dysgonomonas sp. PF1-16]MDH6380713.1 hypothetical protein [Dysgonomonas sp. PFB1-18]MDH6398209.1 hypothetical protein [Dysgonomonas sp. PF1-23]